MNLAVLSYQLGVKLPTRDAYGLVSQMNRSAVSIPVNIAEGAPAPRQRTIPISCHRKGLAYGNRDVSHSLLGFLTEFEAKPVIGLITNLSKC